MKKVLPAILCFALCLAVAFIIPKIGTSNPLVDDSGCLVCHDSSFPSGDLHATHSSFDCGICHVVTGDTPSSSKCIVCHPIGDTGECELVLLHEDSSTFILIFSFSYIKGDGSIPFQV